MASSFANEQSRVLTWSVASGAIPSLLTLSEDGRIQKKSGASGDRAQNFAHSEIKEAFLAADAILEILPSILANQDFTDNHSADVETLGVIKQSSEITTRFTLHVEGIELSLEVANLAALIAVIENEEHAAVLRNANQVLGDLLYR